MPFLQRRITIPTSDQTPVPGPAPHPHPQGTSTDNPRLPLSGLPSGQHRFKRAAQRIKAFIDAGRLGRLLHIAGYAKWQRPQSYYEANDWRGRRALEGGGVIFSQAGHTLDLMQWIAGDRIEWLFANAVTAPVHQGIDIENLGVVTMRFANGATGAPEASTALYRGGPDRLEIHGERGTIELTAVSITRWDIRDPDGVEDLIGDVAEPSVDTGATGASNPMACSHSWHRAQIADFIDAIRYRRPPAVDGGQARILNVLCDAIYESAQTLRIAYPQ